MSDTAERLEYLRGELRAERISYSEIAELQSLAEHIDAGDTELLEAAGVPEFPEEEERYYPTPVWWVDAGVCGVSVEQAGREVGDGTVNEGNIALVLSGDSSYAIEGTREEVSVMLRRALAAVEL